MSRADWFRPKWKWLRRLAFLALMGVAAFVAAMLIFGEESGIAAAILFVTLAPLMIWLAYVPVMHWRERYHGKRPNVWGGFLVFETSGFSKIAYWFAHVLPDWYGSGPYKDVT